jgi:hypothetical protein
VGASKISVKNAAPSVLVVEGTQVHALLSGLTPVLSPDEVEQIFNVARRPETWQSR